MSAVQKFKEFFALDTTMEAEDAYLAPEADYADAPRGRAYMDRDAAVQRPSYTMYNAPEVVEKSIRSFDQAASIGDSYRDGDVVVFSVARMDVAEARRIVDFAAGLCFALRGRMEKVDTGTFALVPEGVTMTKSEIRRALEA